MLCALREGWPGCWGSCLSRVGRVLCPSPWPQGPRVWEGLVTCDADADRRAFLRPVARVGGHTAVDALILMPYLREEQYRAGVEGQGCTLVGRGRGDGQEPLATHPRLFISPAAHSVLWASSRASQATHILYPVNLRRGLSRDDTGQAHSPPRSDGSAFWINQQLNLLWRPELWVGMGVRSISIPGSRPGGPGIDPCLPPYSPLTRGWKGAVFKGLRRGRPREKLQEKVGWSAPPRAGVTVSSDCSVKSPVSGCLLVSSFTIVPVVGRTKSNSQKCWENIWEKAVGYEGTQALTFAIRNQGFPIQVPAKGPCRVASL